MDDVKGFLKVKRQVSEYRPVCERLKDYREVCLMPQAQQAQEQALRCMDCATAFCHWGCPLGNYIPEWNELMSRGYWLRALQLLQATNNFPEFTGRLCPANCEYACVLGINDEPVTIRENELAIIEQAFDRGYVVPNPPRQSSGKCVCVVGSGPAGLACADQLNRAGHKVFVFERDDSIGGILRYGIPDFKLEKRIIDRRLEILKREGIEFYPDVNVGVDFSVSRLKNDFNAVCLSGGSRLPRDLSIEGRDLNGIYFAMDYLTQSNRRAAGYVFSSDKLIDAKGKRVVVIGGGDTGSDCVGTAHRQGAGCVVQIELLPQPPQCRSSDCPWPEYPMILKTSSSHEEGGGRQWSVLTKKFSGEKNRVKKLCCVKVEFDRSAKGCLEMKEVPATEFGIEADLVILALGFVHPEKKGLIEMLGIGLDRRGNVNTDSGQMTSAKGIFCAGDMRSGQSLIVRAIYDGRRAAHHIDKYLMGESRLPVL